MHYVHSPEKVGKHMYDEGLQVEWEYGDDIVDVSGGNLPNSTSFLVNMSYTSLIMRVLCG